MVSVNSTILSNVGNSVEFPINISANQSRWNPLAVDPSSIVVPIMMFALGVVSNSLAICSLLHYKFKGNLTSNSKDVLPPSRNESRAITSPAELTGNVQIAAMYEQRRSSHTSQISTCARKVPVKFGAFHTLVLSLAVLDLLGTLCASPVTFVLYVTNSHIKNHGMSLCHYSAFAMLFFGFITMAMVMAMSVERFLSINRALFYHRHASARKAMLVALMIFTATSILCALPAMGFGAIRPMYPYSWCFADWNAELPKDKAFNYIYVGLGLLMLLITLICNASVIKGLMKMRKNLIWRRRSRRKSLSCEMQMIIQLLVITVIFVICWMPLMFRIFINQLGYTKSVECDRIAIWLVAANPILDPWVYILFRKSVVQHVMRFVKSLLCIKSSSLTAEWSASVEAVETSRTMHYLTIDYSPTVARTGYE